MTTPAEIHTLLRFLSTDAKLPVAQALGKVKELQKANLVTPQLISESDLSTLTEIFGSDAKVAKSVFNAAKRRNKRPASDPPAKSPSKRKKPSNGDPVSLEESLELPEPIRDEEEIRKTVLTTNRAPVVLAFAVTLLKYTMPQQPLSSRLSLAQAAVSLNSRSKAVSLGLESGKSAEEEGWGMGQHSVKVMGRDVRTMKRVGWDGGSGDGSTIAEGKEVNTGGEESEPAFWALDLEALKTSGERKNDGTGVGLATDLPIYTPQSARSYLLKSFEGGDKEADGTKKSTAQKKQADRERNLALLLGSLELLMESWSGTLSARDLDSRAWTYYVKVRPEIANGVAGWGSKGSLKLAEILDLRK